VQPKLKKAIEPNSENHGGEKNILGSVEKLSRLGQDVKNAKQKGQLDGGFELKGKDQSARHKKLCKGRNIQNCSMVKSGVSRCPQKRRIEPIALEESQCRNWWVKKCSKRPETSKNV